MAAAKGNNYAGKAKEVENAIKRACLQEDWKRLRQGIECILDAVATGDMQAIQFVADRLDGKPKQQTEITGEGGGPVVVEAIERVIVDPK